MRLVVDGSGLERPRAGVGVYTSQILRAMSVDRPDCRLEVFGPRRAWMHVPNTTYRLLPRARFFGRHVQWPAAIRKLRPDAYFGPAGSMPLGDVGSPAAITIHDLAIFRNPKWFPRGQPLSRRLVVPRSVLRADVLVAVSESTARDLVELFGIDRGRIQVVPHGVSAKFHPMSAEERAEARARLRLPERFILFVGTVEPRKNLDTLLDAWVLMRDRPDLVVVGSWGWRYEAIKEKMQRLGPRLHQLDSVDLDELPVIYNLARVLAHPAWYEGFGLPPLVVADAGVVVPADEPEAWRKALEQVIADTDMAADLRHRGILRAAQFSWERAAQLTWRAIDEAITRSTLRR